MKHKLKDGRVVEIVPLSAKVPTRWLLDYINGIIEEDAWLNFTKKFSMKEQKEWKKSTLAGIRKGEQMYFAVLYGKRVVGSCAASRGVGRGEDNVKLGIAISKEFRRAGLGEFLMEKTISEAKKKWKPKNIWLDVAAPNKGARKLYEKMGFVEFAKFPKWVKRNGKYHDIIWMILKK
ncbi:GNAT family N-acetyltransferase [Candidatus Micrarchaeota archaeon]|nr:GNAT family N-acetyltransferase [Candidatus Micrarchaeota archaeon]MBD3417428.1 GNAT family N-acetyltransferase [Candidatus Micrarchaeota archaeon]